MYKKYFGIRKNIYFVFRNIWYNGLGDEYEINYGRL